MDKDTKVMLALCREIAALRGSIDRLTRTLHCVQVETSIELEEELEGDITDEEGD